jgi:hypothetical protein
MNKSASKKRKSPSTTTDKHIPVIDLDEEEEFVATTAKPSKIAKISDPIEEDEGTKSGEVKCNLTLDQKDEGSADSDAMYARYRCILQHVTHLTLISDFDYHGTSLRTVFEVLNESPNNLQEIEFVGSLGGDIMWQGLARLLQRTRQEGNSIHTLKLTNLQISCHSTRNSFALYDAVQRNDTVQHLFLSGFGGCVAPILAAFGDSDTPAQRNRLKTLHVDTRIDNWEATSDIRSVIEEHGKSLTDVMIVHHESIRLHQIIHHFAKANPALSRNAQLLCVQSDPLFQAAERLVPCTKPLALQAYAALLEAGDATYY